jgi:hypothetical protein
LGQTSSADGFENIRWIVYSTLIPHNSAFIGEFLDEALRGVVQVGARVNNPQLDCDLHHHPQLLFY